MTTLAHPGELQRLAEVTSMGLASVGFWLLGPALLAGLPPQAASPVAWSPDGRWLAYTLATDPADATIPGGWLRPRDSSRPGTGPARPQGAKASVYRLWAHRPEGGDSTLLFEADGPLTAPSWEPSGRALAFGRVIPGEQPKYEILVQDAPDHQRTLFTRVITWPSPAAEALAGAGLTWSPDGKYIAAPCPEPPGLVILRADNGHLLKTVPGAHDPSWSNDGTKLAYFRADPAGALFTMDTNFGEPRKVAEVPLAGRIPAPLWSRDGQLISVVRQVMAQAGSGRQSKALALVRLHTENGQEESTYRLVHEPILDPNDIRCVSMSLNPEGEEMLYATVVQGQKTQVTWSRPRTGEVRRRFCPLDESVPVSALSFSPTARRAAMRVGPPGVTAPVALSELDPEHPTLLAPDEGTKAVWLRLILQTTAEILKELPARTDPVGPEIERATALPAPGELVMHSPQYLRLRRLARLGRPLCGRPSDGPAAGDEASARLDEARFLLDYLREDYPAALEDLDGLESRTDGLAGRVDLMVLRAQVALGMREYGRAKDVIDYLKTMPMGPSHQVEETATGANLSPIPDPGLVWLNFLSDLQRDAKADNGEATALGHRNPDAPITGLGGDTPDAPRRPAPFRPDSAQPDLPARPQRPRRQMIP